MHEPTAASNADSTLYKADYTPMEVKVPQVTLRVVVESVEEVTAQIRFCLEPNDPHGEMPESVVLDCDAAVKLDSFANMPERQVTRDGNHITVQCLPNDQGNELVFTAHLDPTASTGGHGLSHSNGALFTLFEAIHFRDFAPWFDRPDAPAKWRYEIEAAPKDFPTVLAGGKLVECKDLENGKKLWVYENNRSIPCYLAAMVLGKFKKVEKSFNTHAGHPVTIEMYVDEGREDSADVALKVVEEFILWDEATFGFSMTDDVYRIAVTATLPAGAMETDLLNVFHTQLACFNPRQHTDGARRAVEETVSHEVAHYRSGNQVTIRDFFNVTLKEGITVLREQLFMEEHGSPAQSRIGRVRMLFDRVFPSDNAATANPIYPDKTDSIPNLYDGLVYDKGAEVGRMLVTLMSREKFFRAFHDFVTRYTGEAATVEQFIEVMEDHSGIDLNQFFETWYKQDGVPHCDINHEYDQEAQTFTVHVAQTPKKKGQQPYYFPFTMALFNENGQEYPLELTADEGSAKHDLERGVLHISEAEQKFVFKNIAGAPTPSFFRGYSAPVTISEPQSTIRDATFLVQNETDVVSRYMAMQKVQLAALDRIMKGGAVMTHAELQLFESCFDMLEDSPDLFVELMKLPSISVVAQMSEPHDYMAAYKAREELRLQISTEFGGSISDYLSKNSNVENYEDSSKIATYKADNASLARRACLNLLRWYQHTPDAAPAFSAEGVFQEADNMTEREAALVNIVNSVAQKPNAHIADSKHVQSAHDAMMEDSILFGNFMRIISTAEGPGVASLVKEVSVSDAFDRETPTHLLRLWGGFSKSPYFHTNDGANYDLLIDELIQFERINPEMYARIIKEACFSLGKLPPAQNEKLRASIQRLWDKEGGCSKDVKAVLASLLNISADTATDTVA